MAYLVGHTRIITRRRTAQLSSTQIYEHNFPGMKYLETSERKNKQNYGSHDFHSSCGGKRGMGGGHFPTQFPPAHLVVWETLPGTVKWSTLKFLFGSAPWIVWTTTRLWYILFIMMMLMGFQIKLKRIFKYRKFHWHVEGREGWEWVVMENQIIAVVMVSLRI